MKKVCGQPRGKSEVQDIEQVLGMTENQSIEEFLHVLAREGWDRYGRKAVDPYTLQGTETLRQARANILATGKEAASIAVQRAAKGQHVDFHDVLGKASRRVYGHGLGYHSDLHGDPHDHFSHGGYEPHGLTGVGAGPKIPRSAASLLPSEKDAAIKGLAGLVAIVGSHDEPRSHELLMQLNYALEHYSSFKPRPGFDPSANFQEEIGHLPTHVMLDFYHKFNDRYGHLRPHY